MAESAQQPAAPSQSGIVDLTTAARIVKLTPHRVLQLVRDGWIKKTDQRGKYVWIDVVHGYIEFLRDEGRRASKSAADSRVRDARAAEIELRVAERTKELILFADAMATVHAIYGPLRSEMSGIAARVTRDLALRRKIETEIDGALERASDRISEASAALRAGVDPFATDTEGGTGSVGGEKPDASRNVGSAGTARPDADTVYRAGRKRGRPRK